MPFLPPPAAAGKKRRRELQPEDPSKVRSKSTLKHVVLASAPQDQINLLETQIYESRRHYNNIVTLLSLTKPGDTKRQTRVAACVALCKVYCRLLASRAMVKSKDTAEEEIVIIQWLRERYSEFSAQLLQNLSNPTECESSLTLLFQLVKYESNQEKGLGESVWKQGVFGKLVDVLVGLEESGEVLPLFIEEVNRYDDIRYYTFKNIASTLANGESADESIRTANCITILSAIDPSHAVALLGNNLSDGTQSWAKHVASISAHQKQAQAAWMVVFRQDLTKAQRKSLLSVTKRRIIPWFTKPELLADFLTDSFNVGGSLSIASLSGVFELIQRKNLDYPSFYPKLYSLLDDQVLHSKSRSQFFRLLDQFLSSTHLPAALVASFIKRMSRLALHSPPAGIVVVIPFIYNLLKSHPACTFMIHRVVPDPELRESIETDGVEDPFDMNEADPMETDAIESCLWELVCLQSHYHPNVATLAKIISEQFTKQSYNLEDFLDHSYSEMLEAELAKDLKREPEVEPEIPKRIFTEEGGGLNSLGTLLSTCLEVRSRIDQED